MKKFLLILVIMLLIPLNAFCANIVPRCVSIEQTNTFGVYQVPNEIVLYSEPSESSNIVHSISWIGGKIFPDTVNAQDLFLVFIPDKNLALLPVSDDTEEWVQVIYNNSTGAKGWIKKDDPYRFMSWVMFYNMYGKKYGLEVLKEAPETAMNLHASTNDKSQIVATIKLPSQKINVTAIMGNWALVSVFDIDRVPKTGYIRWRSDNGVKYFFPAMK